MMRERRNQFYAIKSVVVVVVMHLEVMKLQLFLCHLLLRLLYLSIKVFHYMPYIHTTCTHNVTKSTVRRIGVTFIPRKYHQQKLM